MLGSAELRWRIVIRTLVYRYVVGDHNKTVTTRPFRCFALLILTSCTAVDDTVFLRHRCNRSLANIAYNFYIWISANDSESDSCMLQNAIGGCYAWGWSSMRRFQPFVLECTKCLGRTYFTLSHYCKQEHQHFDSIPSYL